MECPGDGLRLVFHQKRVGGERRAVKIMRGPKSEGDVSAVLEVMTCPRPVQHRKGASSDSVPYFLDYHII